MQRLRKSAIWLTAAVALIAVLGFLVAPPIAKSQAERILAERLHRPVTIEQVELNPFALSATVHGLVVKERDGLAVAARFEELYVRASLASALRLAPVLAAVRVTKPHLRVVRNADRSYNFQDLVDEALATRPDPVLRIALGNIQLLGGSVAIDDAVEGQKHEVTDVRVGIPFLSSLPSHVDIEVQPELSARVNGSPVALKGETRPFRDTSETVVEVNLEALDLRRAIDYLPVPLPFAMRSGLLDARMRLAFLTERRKPKELTLSGTATLSRLALEDLKGGPLLALESASVDIEKLDLFARRLAVRAVRVERPAVNVARGSDGGINLLAALPSLPEGLAGKAGSGPPFVFSAAELAVAHGEAVITDGMPSVRPFTSRLSDIEIVIKGLGNEPGRRAEVSASFATDGLGSFRHAGTLQLEPPMAEGRVAAEGFRLARLYPYLEPLLNVDIAGGTVDFEAGYTLALTGGRVDLRVKGASATAKAVVLRYPGEREPFVRVPLAKVVDASVDLAGRRVVIGEVAARNGTVIAHRDADGTLRFTRLLKTQADTAAPAGRTLLRGMLEGGATPWRVDLKRASVEGFRLTAHDGVPAPPVAVQLTQIHARAENWSNAPGNRSRVRATATVNGAGTVAARGAVSLEPLDTALDIDAKGVDVSFAQPYIADRVNLVVKSGAATAKGRLRASAPPGGTLAADYRGDFLLRDFAAVDRVTGNDVFAWKSLRVGGADVTLEPFKASVDEAALSDFQARVILSAQGRLNLQDVLRAEDGEAVSLTDTEVRRQRPAAPAGDAPPGPAVADLDAQRRELARRVPANIRVGRIALEGGQVAFSDFFVRPNYSANLTGITGGVTEMTATQAGEVELRARIDGTAPVEIRGRVNPLSPELFVDVQASAKDIELPPLSPYAIKYAGYGVERGKMSARLQYRVENRTLAADNNVYLDQLTFGEKVDSPTATRLPVLLAVSLLKDRDGVIDVDLPISGSIDDPQFSLWGIIGRVILNLIAKAVTAPFALLGAAFGAGGEGLAYLEFAPGRANLDEPAAGKLATIGKALQNRPGLRLDIAGRVDPEADREALKRLAVEGAVRAEKAKRLAGSTPPPTGPGEPAVAPQEYSEYLKAAYRNASFPRPRNMIGLLKDLPPAEMEALMLANARIGEEDLRMLANARAQAAKDWLVGPGGIPAERVFLVASRLTAEGIGDKGRASRVDFALR